MGSIVSKPPLMELKQRAGIEFIGKNNALAGRIEYRLRKMDLHNKGSSVGEGEGEVASVYHLLAFEREYKR